MLKVCNIHKSLNSHISIPNLINQYDKLLRVKVKKMKIVRGDLAIYNNP